MSDKSSGRPERKPRLSFTKSQIDEGEAAELISLLDSITADGAIDAREAELLNEWLDDHAISGLPGIEYLRSILMHVLEDGKLTKAELDEVYKGVEKVLPIELRRGAKERRQALERAQRLKAREEYIEQREARERLMPHDTYDFMVAGVMYENRGVLIDQNANVGDTIRFVREPTNAFDPNAVKVILPTGHWIGYVPRQDAVTLAQELDGGFRYEARIKKLVTGSRYTIPVITAEIYRPGEEGDNAGDHQVASPPEGGFKTDLEIPHWKRKTISVPAKSQSTDGCLSGCLGAFVLFVVLSAILSQCGK